MCSAMSVAGSSMSSSMECLTKKPKTTIAVIIVEDHNEVLYHIYRAVGAKKIPLENGLMIHFDSHPDLVVPKHLDAERIYEKDYVLNCLSIENWIIPAVYAGHFNTVVWMKPVWASQINEGMHKFKIGKDETANEIKVSCTQSYFVSELSWCPEGDLKGARDVELQVCTLGSPLEVEKGSQVTPSAGEHGEGSSSKMSCALSEEVKKKMDTCPYVLDIDLDFFSTRNPFYSIFNEKQFDILRKLYHYEHPTELTDEILRQVTAKRREQLSELKSIFNNVRDGMDPSASPLLSEVEPLLDTFPDRRPPDPDLLNDAGCTCDDCDLPHHVSTPDEVRHLVGVVKDFLLQNPKPAIITIARSSRDDYCPPEDVNFIQECVLQMLEEVYGSIDVSRDYETDNSEEETAEGEAA